MKPQRTKQTDEREEDLRTDWTATKRESFSSVLKSRHIRHYPHKPETFLFYHGWPTYVLSQTGLCT